MITFRRWLLMHSCLSMALLAGCGGPEPPPRASVKGSVTWEGAPIKSGTITCVPIGDTQGSPTSAIVRDGEYALDLASGPMVGVNRIEIIANRETGETIPAVPPATGEIRKVEQFIPSKFNQSSSLEQDVAVGDNEFDFDLTAK